MSGAIRYTHQDGRRTVVPIYGNETLGKGLILEVLKQINITKRKVLKI